MVYASNYEGLGLGPATLLENCQSQKDHVSNFNKTFQRWKESWTLGVE